VYQDRNAQSPPQQNQGVNGYDLAIFVGIGGLLVLAGVTSASLWVSSAIARPHPMHVTWGHALSVWFHLANLAAWAPPGQQENTPPPLLLEATAVVMVAAIVIISYVGSRVVKTMLAPPSSSTTPPARYREVLGEKALLAKAAVLRPATYKAAKDGDAAAKAELAKPGSLGWYAGRPKKFDPLYGSNEDSIKVLGPPRSGKTTGVVIPRIVEWHGPVLSTSVRRDVADATFAMREKCGPVFAFDPDGDLDMEPFTWSLTAGCEDPLVAQRRAGALASQVTSSATAGKDFWTANAQRMLRVLLHAAALGDAGIIDVQSWLDTQDFRSPRAFLRMEHAVPGWAAQLDQILNMKARETKEGIIQNVISTLEAFQNPKLAALLSPPKGESVDLAEFMAKSSTLYITASENIQSVIAPVVVTIVTELIEAAKMRARGLGRCDPAFLAALDEVANIAPLPNLAALFSAAGGSGITMLAILQSLGQARERWGPAGAEALWGAATVKMIFGGITNASDLREIAALAGMADQTSISHTWSDQGSSTSQGTQKVDRLTLDTLYSLPVGEALVIARGLPPIQVKTGPAPKGSF